MSFVEETLELLNDVGYDVSFSEDWNEFLEDLRVITVIKYRHSNVQYSASGKTVKGSLKQLVCELLSLYAVRGKEDK